MISGKVIILFSALALGFMLPAAAKFPPFPSGTQAFAGGHRKSSILHLGRNSLRSKQGKAIGANSQPDEDVSLPGNTSLEMARDLVSRKESLKGMERVAEKAEHISFSASESFKRNYLAEYAYWCEGTSFPERDAEKKAERTLLKIILVKEKTPGSPVKYLLPDYRIPGLDVKNNERCIQACPKKALLLRDGRLEVDLGRCLGVSCLRCERTCQDFWLGMDRGSGTSSFHG